MHDGSGRFVLSTAAGQYCIAIAITTVAVAATMSQLQNAAGTLS